jgi:hypothetical protein
MTRFAFVLQTIAKVIEQSDLEARLVRIEKALEEDASEPTRPSLPH